jgi:hypothetical protein
VGGGGTGSTLDDLGVDEPPASKAQDLLFQCERMETRLNMMTRRTCLESTPGGLAALGAGKPPKRLRRSSESQSSVIRRIKKQ